MTYPSHDLAPLLSQPPAAGVGYRQGVIVSWDPTTAENVVRVDGVEVANLSILNTTEAVLLRPGDVVGILTTGGAASSWAILGRLTIPGTAAAASALSAVSSGIVGGVIATDQSTTSTTYGDLATVGPTVTATIRGSGKALVIMSAQLWFLESAKLEAGAAVSFTASGANSLATSAERSINMWMQVGGPPASIGLVNQYGGTFFLEGLNPGATTFTMKYRCQVAGTTAHFVDRVLVVWPL